jgi:hypothetical protein
MGTVTLADATLVWAWPKGKTAQHESTPAANRVAVRFDLLCIPQKTTCREY